MAIVAADIVQVNISPCRLVSLLWWTAADCPVWEPRVSHCLPVLTPDTSSGPITHLPRTCSCLPTATPPSTSCLLHPPGQLLIFETRSQEVGLWTVLCCSTSEIVGCFSLVAKHSRTASWALRAQEAGSYVFGHGRRQKERCQCTGQCAINCQHLYRGLLPCRCNTAILLFPSLGQLEAKDPPCEDQNALDPASSIKLTIQSIYEFYWKTANFQHVDTVAKKVTRTNKVNSKPRNIG